MKTRVLVTGHKGFIGRNMCAWLNSQGYYVDGWEWNPDEFPSVVEYDWVIHLGAIADMTETDIDKIMIQNFEFSQWLFNECNTHRTHLQYASSSSVYGNTKKFEESVICKPQTPYAWSKYLFDRWVFRQPNNIIVHGFRYFNVYGKWMHLRGQRANFIHKCRKQARTDGYIEVWAGAEHIKRDWTWVGDICRLHTDFIEEVRGSGIWNAGSGLPHSFLDIAKAIAKDEEVEIREVTIPEAEKERWRQTTCADLNYLKDTIGERQWSNVYEWIESEIRGEI